MPPELEHLSYSSVSAYLTCPRSWRFKYVDKVKTPTAPALAFGSAFHGAVEDLIMARHRGDMMKPAEVWAARWALATEQDIAWNGDLPEEHSNVGMKMLSHPATATVLDQFRPLVEDGEPVVERRVELHIPDVPVPVLGFIDLICADGVPADMKTAARAWTQEQAEKEMQPTYYLAALNQVGYTLNPERKFRHFVWTKTKVPQVQIIESKRTTEDLLWLMALVRDVWHGIEREVYPANPGSWKCSERWCDYWGLCRGK